MATKKLQSKLFGRSGTSNPSQDVSPSPPGLQTGIDSNLKINIPKPPNLTTFYHDEPAPRNSKNDTTDHSHWKPGGTQSFKQFLLNKLGTRYDGVEVYRLEQDARKERHWKRWGPYLAERQWVSAVSQTSYHQFHFILGYS